MIDSLLWFGDYNGEDIHVLADGQQTGLAFSDSLWVKAAGNYKSFSTFQTENAGTTLTFSLATLESGKGVTVNAANGSVTVTAAVDARIHNFLVAATVTKGAESKSIHIRFHVHQSLSSAWLTPSPMRVYKGAKGHKFSVYAQFNDDVIGDITYLASQITWLPGDIFTIQNGGIDVDAKPENTPIDVTAKLPASFGNHTLRGQVIPKKFPDKAQLVSTGSSPGAAKLNEAPNLLFVADGFTDADKGKFECITDNFVRRLATERKTRPYDTLSDSINYWRVFEPSRERGISMLTEVYIKPTGSQTEAWPLEFPQEQTGALTEASVQNWNINNLFFYVGLPVPAQAASLNNDLRTQWKAVLTLADNLIDKISDNLIAQWKERANRRLIEEKDTLLGSTRGKKPRAFISTTDDPDLFSENKLRMKRIRFNALITPLIDGSVNAGSVIGSVWNFVDMPATATTPARPLGKDRDLLVYIVNSKDGRGVNSDGFFFTNVRESDEGQPIPIENAVIANTPAAAHRAIRIAVSEPPLHLPQGPVGTLVHEITHSFTIGDEYGERQSNSFMRYSGPPSTVEDNFANLQFEDDVKSGGNISGALVKWRWHRIKKAAVLTGQPTASGGKFVIPLKEGQTTGFTAPNDVFLRFREFGKPLKKNVPVSPKLVIDSVDSTAHTITVTVPSGTLTPADFPAGSILYKPGEATSEMSYPYPELISKAMIDYLTDKKRPLTPVNTPDQFDDNPIQAPNLSDFPTPTCKKHTPRIVGLYAGGMQYHHGVFHPTGKCIMRVHRESTSEFCVVCRYIIVDQINPAKHPDIDRDYDNLVGPESTCC